MLLFCCLVLEMVSGQYTFGIFLRQIVQDAGKSIGVLLCHAPASQL